jgi:hypothetical protein
MAIAADSFSRNAASSGSQNLTSITISHTAGTLTNGIAIVSGYINEPISLPIP